MKIIIYLLISVIFLGSCASYNNVVSNSLLSKRKHRNGWYIKNNQKIKNSHANKKNAVIASENILINSEKKICGSKDANSIESVYSESNSNQFETVGSIECAKSESNSSIAITAANSNHISFLNIENESHKSIFDEEDECAEMIKRNGDIIEVKVIEVGVSEIKYKKCEHLDGPIYSILKSDVFMIKYSNGEKDVFKEDSKPNNTDSDNKPSSNNSTFDFLGFFGMLIGISGVIVYFLFSWPVGLGLGLTALILGVISSSTEKKNPGTWRTKNTLGTISSVIGFLVLSVGILLLFI